MNHMIHASQLCIFPGCFDHFSVNVISLNIRLNGNEVIEAQTIPAGTASFTIELSGTGTKFYELFINGEPYRTEKVVFTDG